MTNIRYGEDWEDQIDLKSAVGGPKAMSRTGKGIPQQKKDINKCHHL